MSQTEKGILDIQEMKLNEQEREGASGQEALLEMQVAKVLRILRESGIHGYPGGDHECFCLWPIPDALNLPEEGRRRDEWAYPDELIKEKEESGTLIWLPDAPVNTT